MCLQAIQTSGNGNEKTLIGIEYNKNRRRNTSILLKYKSTNGDLKTVLIDCGKTFYDSALIAFPKFHLRQIDAVILTHPHADAMFGLDDLRAWTMSGRVQKHIDIYLTQSTFEKVESAFPYMVDKSFATGGGEVPTLKFHVFDTHGTPDYFMIQDELKVIPIPVTHGTYSNGDPFPCMGYRIQDLVYISDVNEIPNSSMNLIQGARIGIMDALKSEPHASHFSYQQALDTLMSILIPNGIGYFTGFCHNDSHDTIQEWVDSHKPRKDVDVFVSYDFLHVSLDNE